ncbi:hypothetical protein FC40_GL000437 [Ligilactobacillus hayakitensis DSM 18933 = JCM 14209]|uniref:Uncharacterized protein n=1 Tax=Ligilactobacillus hayakitensis DSM 18933 = JCM 14209 TaxID=1423755 RepID=A0A0R1WMK5_9LACO|nr:hypothetical protein [Ligilactobacillus hayakitensis]KRM19144.1 hypothetical protein FC40_GL000437 [Ligilactobacillus hayakitensis DSM 18933 = JCM 14209]
MNTLMNVSNRTNKRILNDMVGLAARKNVKIIVAGDPTFKKMYSGQFGTSFAAAMYTGRLSLGD